MFLSYHTDCQGLKLLGHGNSFDSFPVGLFLKHFSGLFLGLLHFPMLKNCAKHGKIALNGI